jgi:hypothetical protein
MGQTKDYKIGIYYFSTEHAALRSKKNSVWLGIRIMCQGGPLFQQASTIKKTIACWSSMGHHYRLIEKKLVLAMIFFDLLI